MCRRAAKAPRISINSLLRCLANSHDTSQNRNINTRRASTVTAHKSSNFPTARIKVPQSFTKPGDKSVPSNCSSPNPITLLRSVVNGQKAITASNTVPDEVDVLELLDKCRGLSEILMFGETDAFEETEEKEHNSEAENDEGSSTSSLLNNLEEESQRTPDNLQISHVSQLPIAVRETAKNTLIRLVDSLLLDPKIFITPEMLQAYVRIQALLGAPERMPEIFHLYAHKPVPSPNTSPIKYMTPDPKSLRNAIPTPLADAALDSAISKHNLPLALNIIDTSFRAPAFPRAKLLKRAGPPFAAIACLPVIAAAAGQYVSDWQNTLDPSTATWMTVAGFGTYFGVTGTIGYVSLTTSNDQMERVTWAPGLSLWKRWMREEERSAFDRIALAWGFRDRRRRGEETGEDWEALREFCGMRDMVLDKTNLMDDME
ncbi:MAG: hypothetical protein Q9160_000116 [Pyrenula sp. 1 TL-2023]